MRKSERAFYLIGAAVMQQLACGERDPDTVRSMTDVVNWIEYWLSQDDLDFLETVGLLFNVDRDDELRMNAAARNRRPRLPPDIDDDIPF